MKKVLFLLLFLPILAGAQNTFTAPVGYNTGPPTAAPSAQATRWRFDLLTGRTYKWSPTFVSWLADGYGIDVVSGCVPPAYTPGYAQSIFAVNNCDSLYMYRSGAWRHLNPGGGGGSSISAGAGITISGTPPDITISADDDSPTNELNVSMYIDSGSLKLDDEGGTVSVPLSQFRGGIYSAGTGIALNTGTGVITNTGDLSTTNELNTAFVVTGGNLRLTDPGGSLDVPVSSIAPVQAVAAGSGISISGTATRTITATDDSPTNEIQTLSIVGGNLSISSGNTVSLPSGGLTSLNGLTGATQTFSTGSSGTDFGISSSGTAHTFNIPSSSASNRGALTSSDWSAFNSKIGGSGSTGQIPYLSAATTISGDVELFWSHANKRLGLGTSSPSTQFHQLVPAATNGYRIDYSYSTGATNRPFALVNQDGVETVAYGANRTANEGILYLSAPSAQGGGSGINFSSNVGATTRAGSFGLDGSGNMIFRQGLGSMFYDYYMGVFFRDNTFATRMHVNGADVNIGTTFSNAARLVVNGSNGYSQINMAQAYTPTGTSDALGSTGNIAWDANYIYIKTAAGWKRAALSTF
jgi:hypothetical protein